MKVLFISILLFVSFPSFAKDSANIVEFLNQLNSGFVKPSVNQCTDTKEILRQCAVDLCGKPNAKASAVLNDATFATYTNPDLMKRFSEVENNIKDLVKIKFEDNKKYINDLRSKIKNGKLEISNDDWSSKSFNDFAEKIFESELDIKVDTNQELSKRLIVNPIYPKNVSDNYKKAIDSYAEEKRKLALSDVKKGLEQYIYTKEEAKKIVLEKWDNFLNKFSNKLKDNPDFMKNEISQVDSTKEDVKNYKGDLYESSSIISSIEMLESYYEYRNTGNYPKYNEVYACNSDACKDGVREYVGKIEVESLVTEFEKENDLEKMTRNHLNYCKSNLALRSLKDSDSNKIRELFPEIKKRLLKHSTKGFSDHSKKSYETYIDENINLSFKNKNESVDEFITTINDKHSRISNDQSNESSTAQDSILKLISFRQMDGGLNPMQGTYFCYSDMETAVWDGFLPKKMTSDEYGEDLDLEKDNIMVSKFSCTHSDVGSSVLAHELGHAMSWAFQEGKLSEHSLISFKKLRSCANSQYNNPTKYSANPFLKYEGDTLYTEEDTADLIAYMAYPETDFLMQCSLLDIDVNGEYTNLGLQNIYNQDSHSASMYRVIMEAIIKNKNISQSCLDVIEAHPEYRFKSCI